MIDERWDADVEEIADALRKILIVESDNEAIRKAESEHDGISPDLELHIREFGLDQLEGSAALFARVALELGRALASTAFVETMPVLALTARPGVSYGFGNLVPASVPTVAVTGGSVRAEPLRGTPRRTAAGDMLVEHQSCGAGEEIGGGELSERIERYSLLTNAARIVGAGQALLEYTVAYAKEREQFGRPIGSFQAIRHRLANVVADLDAAELLVRKAAFTAESESGGDGAPPRHFAIMVWAKAVQAGRLTATNAHQVFGGNGFAMEYDVQLYSRRIRSWATRGPRVDRLLAELGRMVLDPAKRDRMSFIWQFQRGIQIPRWAQEADSVGARNQDLLN